MHRVAPAATAVIAGTAGEQRSHLVWQQLKTWIEVEWLGELLSERRPLSRLWQPLGTGCSGFWKTDDEPGISRFWRVGACRLPSKKQRQLPLWARSHLARWQVAPGSTI